MAASLGLGARRAAVFQRPFYFFMALMVAAVAFYGFSRTVERGLFHPAFIVPAALYAHVAIFVGWIALLIVQTGLVQMGQVKLHRLLGWAGVGFAVVLVLSGLWVAVTMARIEAGEGDADAGPLLIVPFVDMANFSTLFALGALFRKRLEAHRRLMIMAAVSLTGAAFSRFPAALIPHGGWYCVAVDLFMGLGVIRDLIVLRRVHSAYLFGIPALMAVQWTTLTVERAPFWATLANRLIH